MRSGGFVTSKTKRLIAIVDDDESVCRAIKRLVRSLGMERKLLPRDGTLGTHRCDAVVSAGLSHPRCSDARDNGLDVQDELLSRSTRLPIVFITAHDELGMRERAMSVRSASVLA